MAIRVTCQCGRIIHARSELAGKKVKCPQCGEKVAIPRQLDNATASEPLEAGDAPSEPRPTVVVEPQSSSPSVAKRAWKSAASAVPFYWSQRAALRSCLGNLFQPLQSPNDQQQVIRLTESELDTRARRAAGGWEIDLPPCCVVCGELSETSPQQEQHLAQDLTLPICVPPSVVSLGAVVSLFTFNLWYLPLSVAAAPFLGAIFRRSANIRLNLVRCSRHIDRRDLPQLFSFGQTLMIRTGSSEVVDAFSNPQRLAERQRQPVAAASAPSTPTPGADEPPASAPTAPLERPTPREAPHRYVESPISKSNVEAPSGTSPSRAGFTLESPPVAPAALAEPRLCRACGRKLLPQESSCPRCQTRQAAPLRARIPPPEREESPPHEEPLSMLAAIGKLVLSITELLLLITLLSALGAGAVYFAPRIGLDLTPYLLPGRGIDPLIVGAAALSALGMMMYYGATGFVVRNSIVAVAIVVGLAWWFQWSHALWEYAVLGGVIALVTGVLQGMFESRFAEPLSVVFAPGTGMLPGRPSRAGLAGVAKGVLAGGLCGFLLGVTAGYPVYLYAAANGWDVGGRGAWDYSLLAGGVVSAAMAYLAGQFSMTKAERIGPWRGMYLGAALWGFCSLVCATGIVAWALFAQQSDRSPRQLATLAITIVAGAIFSGGLIGLISGALGRPRRKITVPRLR